MAHPGRFRNTRTPQTASSDDWLNRVHSVTIPDFRQIKELTLPLHHRMTVLIGLNGSGKSSVLAAINAQQCDFRFNVKGLSLVIDPPKVVDRLIADHELTIQPRTISDLGLDDDELVLFDPEEMVLLCRLLQQGDALSGAIADIFNAVIGDDTGQTLDVCAPDEPGAPISVYVLRGDTAVPIHHASKGTREIAILAIIIGFRQAIVDEEMRRSQQQLKEADLYSKSSARGTGGSSKGGAWVIGSTVLLEARRANTIGNGGGRHRLSRQPGLLLLDEPGVGLHPGAQKRLLEYLKRHAKLQQIVLATHSPFLIDLEAEGNSAILAVEMEAGGVQVRPLDQAQDHRALLPWREAIGLDLTRQILLEHPTLLVEGKSDRHYLSAMSGFCDAALRPGTGIVQGGGTRRMVPTVHALTSFDQVVMRPSELIVLLDSDLNNGDADQVEQLVTRVVKCGDHARPLQAGTKRLGEIEDLFEPAEYLALFVRRYPHLAHVTLHLGGPPPRGPHLRCGSTTTPKAITAMLKQIGDPLANENFHAEVSQQLADDPDLLTRLGVSDATRQRFASLIEAINAHVDAIRAGRRTRVPE